MRLVVLSCLAASSSALVALAPASLRLGSGVAAPRLARVSMISRYEDGDEKRLSQGGGGGRYGNVGNNRRVGVSGTDGWGTSKSQRIRQANLEAYVNSEEAPADGTIVKIIAGCALFSILGGLIGIYMYYGGDSIMATLVKGDY